MIALRVIDGLIVGDCEGTPDGTFDGERDGAADGLNDGILLHTHNVNIVQGEMHENAFAEIHPI